ncbi:MAG: hypothetical protein QOG26_1697 [Solirubrobacterales bacterium]|nr:hypothetical protein [Solirubrobacterales bacterium]
MNRLGGGPLLALLGLGLLLSAIGSGPADSGILVGIAALGFFATGLARCCGWRWRTSIALGALCSAAIFAGLVALFLQCACDH